MPDQRTLRRELWECIRFWLFDCHFTGSLGFPTTDASDYGFTQNVMHALSHWKLWLQRKPEFQNVKLTAHYKHSNREDNYTVNVRYQPDSGEINRHDYSLFQNFKGGAEVLCCVESEGGRELVHVEEDFPKLLGIQCPLKVMIYRVNYKDKEPVAQSFAARKTLMESMLNQHIGQIALEDQSVEEWLFIGIPWYKHKLRTPHDTYVRLNVLSLPDDYPVSLQEPDWDIWEPAPKLEAWIRSLYSLSPSL